MKNTPVLRPRLPETDLEPIKKALKEMPFNDLVHLVEWMKQQGILTVNQELRVDRSTVN